jgi:hypothetical protein
MRSELRRGVPLLVLFAIGLAAGVWILVSPWVLGYPFGGGWTAPVRNALAVGSVLVVASAASLVVVLARAVHVTLRSGHGETGPHDGHGGR